MEKKKNPEKHRKQLLSTTANNYVKYSAAAFQMIAIIGIFTFIGYKIDEKQESETLIFTAFFSLSGVILSIYSIIRSLNKK